jgi:hypothetical protein
MKCSLAIGNANNLELKLHDSKQIKKLCKRRINYTDTHIYDVNLTGGVWFEIINFYLCGLIGRGI